MGKAQIIRRIHNSAKKYKQYFVGNTYMFVYENEFIRVTEDEAVLQDVNKSKYYTFDEVCR